MAEAMVVGVGVEAMGVEAMVVVGARLASWLKARVAEPPRAMLPRRLQVRVWVWAGKMTHVSCREAWRQAWATCTNCTRKSVALVGLPRKHHGRFCRAFLPVPVALHRYLGRAAANAKRVSLPCCTSTASVFAALYFYCLCLCRAIFYFYLYP